MKKFSALLLFFQFINTYAGFAQPVGDGSYLWKSTSIGYSFNDKTELIASNKVHYNNQINHVDYFQFELIGYRKLTNDFSLGLGFRQTESYKSVRWDPGQTYMLYGVYFLNPKNVKIRVANRLISRTYKFADTQNGIDNITNVDFFVLSTRRLPKPYITDEVFFNLNSGKVHTIRLYGGFHILKKEHLWIDAFYCYWKMRPSYEWLNYNVLGLSTKIRI
jgi:hypothetical protein